MWPLFPEDRYTGFSRLDERFLSIIQGKYLGKALKRTLLNRKVNPFHFGNMGMMASLGGQSAMADLPKGTVTGRKAWWLWRSVYLTKLVGFRKKLRLLGDWFQVRLFGRDTSRIP
jgi:NADH dehydrogenase